MNILVTGGLGFIGSHTVVELLKSGHKVVIVDNLANSKREVLDKIGKIVGTTPPFYPYDATEEKAMDEVFSSYSFDGVIHFAGLKAVGESVEKPLEYYYSNLVSTIVLSKLCLRYGVNRFVFSSSATVYGDQPSPLREDMELGARANPYGETKAISERILMDISLTNPGFSVSLLRYFNPVGAHESGLIGEDPNGIPNNLMPYISKVAKGDLSKLNVYGSDYDTVDGTGIRDYIHVMDLAYGHVKALEHLSKGVEIYNLGTGRGTSVLEMVRAFEMANGVEIPYELVSRRSGDVATCYADSGKANQELGWRAERTILEMCRDSWNFAREK